MKKIAAILIFLSILFCTLFTGCGKPSVNLNDYVTISDSGYDGYGSIWVSVDYTQMIEDYSDRLTDKSLNTQYFGDKTPALAAEFVISAHEPYLLVYEESGNLKNGDTVEFSWNTNEQGIKMLKEILDVNIVYSKFTHKVSELNALQEVDPFETVEYEVFGFSGDGTLSTYNTMAIVNLGNDKTIELDLESDYTEGDKLSNGDMVTFSLTNLDDEYYAENYGIILTRKSAEVAIDGLKYFPTENPREIFECLSEEDIKNVETALIKKYDWYRKLTSKYNIGDVKAEYVGALYHYSDIPTFEYYSFDENGMLTLVFHVTNDVFPGGWYVYMNAGSNNATYIKFCQTEDGVPIKKTTLGNFHGGEYENFPAAEGNYSWGATGLTVEKLPTEFKYDGKTYCGYQTLEKCIEAYMYYAAPKAESGNIHLVVTDGLQGVVEEY